MKQIILGSVFILLFSLSGSAKILDNTGAIGSWRTEGESGTIQSLRLLDRGADKGIQLNYTFISGNWLQMFKEINEDFSDIKAVSFYFKGDGRKNNFEFKLVDKNNSVFGKIFEAVTISPEWQKIVIPVADMRLIWSENKEFDPVNIKKIFFTVTKLEGGTGTIAIGKVEFLNEVPSDVAGFKVQYKKVIKQSIDDMDVLTGWLEERDNNTKSSIFVVNGYQGQALKLKYEFNNGKWLQMKKNILSDISGNSKIVFYAKAGGDAVNTLQFKLEDEKGTVYGMTFENFPVSDEWKKIEVPFAQLIKFWGTTADQIDLAQIKKIYFAVILVEGKNGYIMVDDLKVE